METHINWHEGIFRRVSGLKDRLSPMSRKKDKLTYFVRASGRVASFSVDCEECRSLKSQIIGLSQGLRYSLQMTEKEYRTYLRTLKGITKHLKRKHGLVEEKQYIRRFVSVGAAFGLSLVMSGLVLINFGITVLALSVTLPALAGRIIIGYTIGYLLDRRARKRGRVI